MNLSDMCGAKLPALVRFAFAALMLTGAAASAQSQTWQDQVNAIIGWEGQQMPDDVLRFTLTPKLDPVVRGVPVFANLVLDGYAAFHPEGAAALMAAEVVVPDYRVDAVVTAAQAQGITVSAVHNHVLRERPRMMFIHMNAFGDPATLAQGLMQAIGAAGLPLHHKDDQESDDVATGLNEDALESIMKADSTAVDHVLEFSFDRPESFTLEGHMFPPAMGAESEVHFQSLGGDRAAEVAEIALLANEVPKAIQTLKDQHQHVEVTALHNHFLMEGPRLFFLHTWGVGDQQVLARTLRAVLDQTPQQ